MSTLRQRRGSRAEEIAARYVAAIGWRTLGRNIKVGVRDEIDIVAIDPVPRPELVCIEVRSSSSAAFGAAEERVDARKVAHLYRAALAFSRSQVARELGVASLPVRVDLVVVDMRERSPEIRHLPKLEPT